MIHSRKDIRGIFWTEYRNIKRRIHRIVSTPYMRFMASLKGIELGEGVKFSGVMYFNRHIKSLIRIGNNCRFNSAKDSVEIRLYNPCCFTTMREGAEIIIGNNVGATSLTLHASKSIRIGNNVLLGANSTLIDSDAHHIDPALRNTASSNTNPIIIEDNVFIGFNCMILKGITIGRNSVIGANSVVIQSIPPNSIAMGNPCKVIIKRNWEGYKEPQ